MHRVFALALTAVSIVAFLGTSALYAYPPLFGCAFPAPGVEKPAPFRLLVLGDPQLEGDSSLPLASNGDSSAQWPHELKHRLREDLPLLFRLFRKRLDLLGNDYYLAHIYRTLTFFLEPTHVVVLGDLLGSQWISDDEFARRAYRYWNRVFSNGRRLEDEIADGGTTAVLGEDPLWKRRIMNVVGNHDIGYAGDIDLAALERFEHVFGRANFETRFTLPSPPSDNAPAPELRIINLNSLNLDVPVLDHALQASTYDFINTVIDSSHPVDDTASATILLTHIPLHKDEGVCVDRPMIKYYENERHGAVREQNHLSYHSSQMVLESIFGKSGNTDAPAGGMGRNGLILTGHDHEGCDVWHHLPHANGREERRWMAKRWNETTAEERVADVPGIREVTVRSMMGEFGGNAGFLSAWFDDGAKRWRIEYSSCMLGKQHWWWAVHVIDLLALGVWMVLGIKWVWKRRRWPEEGSAKEKIH